MQYSLTDFSFSGYHVHFFQMISPYRNAFIRTCNSHPIFTHIRRFRKALQKVEVVLPGDEGDDDMPSIDEER